jgi:hypothetical protein
LEGRKSGVVSRYEALCPQGGASRKGNSIHIVPLDPASKAGIAGHVPAKIKNDDLPLTTIQFKR